MLTSGSKVICWVPTWSRPFKRVGLEHVVLTATRADSVLLAIDEDGTAFRLTYQLKWDRTFAVRRADLEVTKGRTRRTLSLRSDGRGTWFDARGARVPRLAGCIDIDIWPTPLTNSVPIWRSRLRVGQRREFRMAWIAAPALTVQPVDQAYTKLAKGRYLFESLDGSGFRATLDVDRHGLVTRYPGLFERVGA
ncbi:MAG: putative glycolipid-binding domain-containing protein [Vicinamibacterales bacterium]